MSRKRVIPFGMGQTLIKIDMSELPKDIQEGLIELHSRRTDEYKITKDTKSITLCGYAMCKN